MATGKKYYWIKLKTDFMTSDKVDFLMSQKNGAEYVVLYQMLCMKCINTDGLLARKIGEVIIPFDEEKIARDCKYFTVDTVKVAFSLFIKLGMIYQETNGCLKIADFENMVGSETDWAERKRLQRQNKETQLMLESNNSMDNVQDEVQENVHERLEIEIRDIDIELNSISTEKSNNKQNLAKNFKKKEKQFIAPTLDEVKKYIQEKNYTVDAQVFFDYYQATEWHDVEGKKVKNWKGKIVSWNARNNKTNYNQKTNGLKNKFTPIVENTHELTDAERKEIPF